MTLPIRVRVTDRNPAPSYLKIITQTITGGANYTSTIGGTGPEGVVREGVLIPGSLPSPIAFQVKVTGIPSTALVAGYPVTNTATIVDRNEPGSLPNVPDAIAPIRIMPRRIFLPLVLRNYPPPWQQVVETDGIRVYDIAVCPSSPDRQYAGTESGLYHSTDGGTTWGLWALDGQRATPVVVNQDCTRAFAAVWGSGVYRVTGQNQATLFNQGLGDELYLYGLVISTNGQTLYGGSNSHGVYKTSTDTAGWTQINIGIPVSDRRIRSLYVISDTLYAGGRQCTYYYSSDGGNSWTPETIPNGVIEGGVCGDAQMWAIAGIDNALYASLGEDKGLYRRSASGTWTRVSDVPAVTIYRSGLHSYLSRLYVGTYGNGVYTCDSDGNCQSLRNSGLGTSNIRGLAVANTPDARLLAGSDNGIWWVPLEP